MKTTTSINESFINDDPARMARTVSYDILSIQLYHSITTLNLHHLYLRRFIPLTISTLNWTPQFPADMLRTKQCNSICTRP